MASGSTTAISMACWAIQLSPPYLGLPNSSRVAAAVMETVMSGQHFPVAGRVGQAAGMAHQAVTDPEHALSFGLERILDGVEVLIARRQHEERK